MPLMRLCYHTRLVLSRRFGMVNNKFIEILGCSETSALLLYQNLGGIMKNNIIIDKELSIRPVDGFDYFTQHSVGTKYVAAKLDGWAPAADEHLFIAFEKADGSYKIDPIILGRTVDRVYFTVVPEEVIHDDGEWTMCIYKKLHWNETTGKADLCEVGKKFTFTVMSTIRDDSGNVITQYDLVNLAQFQKDLENGHYAARGIYSWNKDYLYGAGELVFYPNHGEYGTFLKSTIVDNDNAPYVNGALNSAYWEEVVDFDILNGLYDVRDEVAQSAAAAAASAGEAAQTVVNGKTEIAGIIAAGQAGIDETAERAEQSATAAAGSAQSAAGSVEQAKGYADDASAKATEAENWADVAKHYAQFGLKLNTDYTSVNQLPVPGNAQNIYLIPNGASGNNGYDEYVWIESKSAYEKLGTTEIDLTDYATKAQVANEVTSRESADTALGVRIDGTETAIATLQRDKASVMSLNSETSARESADTALGARIDGNDTDIAALQSGKVSKSGDTMTGPLNLPQGQQARGYKDTGVTFEYSNKNPSGFYSSVFARYDKCFVCGEGGDKAIFQYDYSNGWNTKVSNNGIEELSVLWMDKNGHLLDNGSRVSLREDRETEQKYAKYINTTPGSSYTKIATVKAEEPSLLTVYGMETSEMGGIIISNEPSLRGGTEWSHTPNADELARAEGEQGYWGKQYLCCTVLVARGAKVYVWGRQITNLYYTLQPIFKN